MNSGPADQNSNSCTLNDGSWSQHIRKLNAIVKSMHLKCTHTRVT
ncbi:hypothetical protein LINPERPRIM_LOCUS15958 [Linum perenne]